MDVLHIGNELQRVYFAVCAAVCDALCVVGLNTAMHLYI